MECGHKEWVTCGLVGLSLCLLLICAFYLLQVKLSNGDIIRVVHRKDRPECSE